MIRLALSPGDDVKSLVDEEICGVLEKWDLEVIEKRK